MWMRRTFVYIPFTLLPLEKLFCNSRIRKGVCLGKSILKLDTKCINLKLSIFHATADPVVYKNFNINFEQYLCLLFTALTLFGHELGFP